MKAKSWGWHFYFIFTIAAWGFPLSFGIAVPMYIVGYFIPKVRRHADRFTRFCIGILMDMQPWYKENLDLGPIPELIREQKGFLIVSNHRSHLDAFLLLSNVDGVRILMRSSLYVLPFINVMMLATRQIASKRGDLASFLKAMDKIRNRMKKGEVVHVFPEMTRCNAGMKGTQEFALAPFGAAKSAGVLVVPMAISGTDDIWPRGSFGLGFRKPVTIKALDAMDSKQFASAQELRDYTRERINVALA